MVLPMLPPSVIAAGSRLGPYLGRLAKQNAAVPGQLVKRLRTAGADITDVIPRDKNWLPVITAWVKKSPINAFSAVATLAAMGHSIIGLFSGSDDPETKALVNGLVATTARAGTALQTAAAKLIDDAGHATESLKGLDPAAPNALNVEAVRETLAWALSAFGSAREAMIYHRYFQAFVEIPKEHVAYGYENLSMKPPQGQMSWKFTP